jgi:hypothetical protein
MEVVVGYFSTPFSAALPARQEVRNICPAADRALAEAEARRLANDPGMCVMPKEFPTWKGPEPTRYGDWENKGIASDF